MAESKRGSARGKGASAGKRASGRAKGASATNRAASGRAKGASTTKRAASGRGKGASTTKGGAAATKGTASKGTASKRSGASERSSHRNGGMTALEVAGRAREQMQALLGRPVEAVLGMDRDRGSWILTVQVVELAR